MSDNPTTGLGVAAAVVLTGTGVHLISPTVAGTRGKSTLLVTVTGGTSIG
jgi:ABC-type cobalamin transport system ATPase subunit